MQRIPRQVKVLGIVSLLNDMASEMVYPVVPIFLTTVLHASIPTIGFIDGFAEATASLTKYWFGRLSDRQQRRKPFVVAGYSLGALSKTLIGLATIWPMVWFARFTDRLGKGLRTAPRDSLLLAQATPQNRGLIFGFHRSLDSLGAVIGPLLALVLLWFVNDLRSIFFLATIPGILSVLLLIVAVRDQKLKTRTQPLPPLRGSWRKLPSASRWFVVASSIFALGNSADSFIILRGQSLDLATATIILMYVCYNVAQTILATPAGMVSDRIGPKRVILVGWLVFAIIYGCIGFIHQGWWLWLLFPLYGIYIAFTDGVGKAYISTELAAESSGTIFGLYHSSIAIGNFFASVIGGLLWYYLFPAVTFWYGSVLALSAMLVLLLANAKTAVESGRRVGGVSVRTAS